MKSKTAKVALALILCPLVMLALSFVLPKRYTATMSLMLDPSINAISGSDPNATLAETIATGRGRSIETEIDKITGSEVLLHAIELTAAQHPKAFADQEQAEARYTTLVNRLRIDNNRNSDIVDVRVTMDDPQIAADTANNIGKAYQDYNDKVSSASGTGALMKINADLADKEKQLQEIDSKIATIKSKYNISDPTAAGQIQDKFQKDIEAQIDTTQAEYDGAVGELNAARQALATTPKYLVTGTDVQVNPAVLDLQQKISQTDSDLQASRAKYTDDYPLVKQYQDKLNSLKAELARTPANIQSRESTTLNPNYTNARAALDSAMSKVNSYSGSLAALTSKLSEIKSEGAVYPKAERELSALLLSKNTIQQQYATLQLQKNGLDVNGGAAREAPAQIVSIAMPPGTPSFPNPKVFVLMGLAVGIIISALIVMPKAPDVMYAPTVADTLALDGTSIRANTPILPQAEPEPVRPAIESGKTS